MIPTTLAAGFNGAQILGPCTVTALAVIAGICFISGLRGSDKVKIGNKDQAIGWGFITGALWIAAGGMWADFARGIGDVGTGLVQGGGNLGAGGTGAALIVLAWAPRWGRMVIPGFLALAGSVVMGQAGGIGAIAVNAIRMMATKITGG